MKEILFNPFDINKWFVLGFTAFLAGLLDGPRGGNSPRDHTDRADWDNLTEFPATAWNWLMDHHWWFGLIIFGIFFFTVLIIVFNWLSSRGKFMFLDNVVHNRAKVTDPWNRYAKEGNSLFLWRLVYGFICLFVFMALIFLFFMVFLKMNHAHFPGPAAVMNIIGMILVFLTFLIITGYIKLFMNDFVVPIMYKYNLTALKAWGKFLPLFANYFWYFILYGIFIFILVVVVIMLVIMFGLMTCCIGIVFLIIPYIGSVLFLPVSVTFRALSVEFLEQFGPEYEIFPRSTEKNVVVPETGK